MTQSPRDASGAAGFASRSQTRASFDEAFLARLERLRLVARRRANGARAGARRSIRRGAGLEPSGHRAYAPGDDFRRVDWNAFRRLERLYVTEREEESERSVAILLDRSASMGRGGKLELGRSLAAALAYLALADGDRVLPASFAEERVTLGPPCRGSAQIFSVFRFLDAQEPKGTTGVAEACRALARGPRRPGLAVVITDFLDESPARATLAALAEGRREVVLLHLVAPEDERPDLSGYHEIVDCETGEALVLACDASARRDYARAFDEWTRELAQAARSLGAIYVRARSDESLETVTLTLLREGGVLG
jgi:uncharacterized protein (DUF58 family)